MLPARRSRVAVFALLITGAAAASLHQLGEAQPPAEKHRANAPARGPWTLDQAMAHLQLFPRDAYVQYVALQLSRREGKGTETAAQIERLAGTGNRARFQANERRSQVDMFSILSGSIAVQESLQLDAMRGDAPNDADQIPRDIPQPRRRAGPRALDGRTDGAAQEQPRVAIADLEGPTIKSHPWETMLAGQQPEISQLARSVPEDFYLVEFKSLNKLLEASDLTSLWGAHLLNQTVQEAQTQLVGERLREQLAVEVSPLLKPFYDSVVQSVALAGSDLFLREGSDVTLLFHVRDPKTFRAQLDGFLTKAEKARPDAQRSTGNVLGVPFDHVTTADRRVHVFSAYPTPNLHVRSNSRVALERVIAVIQGKPLAGENITPLGDTTEFAYIRTLMKPDAPEEDGLIYLSDPFIRRLVGPALRLTENRRMRCYNHLKMIGHAGLMYRTEQGRNAASLDELAEAECCPGEFGKAPLACPDGGEYSLAEDGLTGVCSHHGYASYLTPCCEIEATHVTQTEADAYNNFLQAYNQYWRQFFDPIAIRLQISPERYRAETIILPLIDNSLYTQLAQVLGGKPEQLDALPVPERNIFSLGVRLNKEHLLREMGMEHLLEAEPADGKEAQGFAEADRSTNALRQLALAMLNHESARKSFPPRAFPSADKPNLSWRVAILPYLEDSSGLALYQQFRQDEPWDSPHNKRLIAKIPDVFKPSDPKLAAAGKTKFVVAEGENTIFDSERPVYLKTITDGLSNTILLLETIDENAVVWTKPDDVEVKPERPGDVLQRHVPGGYLVGMGDGSVQMIRENVNREGMSALLVRNDDQMIPPEVYLRDSRPVRNRRSFASLPIVEQLDLGTLLAKGIGNQIGFHAYDAEPTFDLSLSRLMGMGVSNLRRGGFDDDLFPIFMVVGSLNSPVYISVPVKDAAVVDEFLHKLDGFLAALSHERQDGFFFSVGYDFYELKLDEATAVRSFAFSVGPIKWRVFWSRVGQAVYVASKPEVLRDLIALDGTPLTAARRSDDPPAHAMVRLRPQHWNRALENFQLGWEESNRQACLKNLGPLGSLSRALNSTGHGSGAGQPVAFSEVTKYAARLHDVRYFCPDGGQYAVGEHGASCTCSVHGTLLAPRQAPKPAEASELGKLLRDFQDMNVSLTFLEDGLHATVVLERTPPKEK
jgi:hypothetical protein